MNTVSGACAEDTENPIIGESFVSPRDFSINLLVAALEFVAS